MMFPVLATKSQDVKYSQLGESIDSIIANGGDVTNSEDDSDVDVFNVRRDRKTTRL